MLSKEFTKKLEKKHIPFYASIEITSQCNLSCKFCYLDCKEEKSKEAKTAELSLKELKDTLDQLASLGSLFLCLTGGEPLLRGDFWEIIRYAHEQSFAISLKTNGTLIGQKEAGDLAKLNIYRVDISLLGATPEVHDGMSGVVGSWKRTLAGVRLLKEEGMRVFLMATFTRDNFPAFREMRRLAKEMGVGLMTNPLVYPTIDGGNSHLKYRLSEKELLSYYQETIPTDLKARLKEDVPEDFLFCSAGRVGITINHEGKVYPCIGFPWEVGDLRQSSLKSILETSERLIFFRSLTNKDLKICSRCSDNLFCSRCPGLAYLETGDILGVSPENCRLAKVKKEVMR